MKKIISLIYLSFFFLYGCAQQTIEPTVVNTRNLRIQSIKPTGTTSQNVLIALYDNQQATKLLDSATTGESGVFNMKIDIPTFGHSYLLTAKKYYPQSNTLLQFSRTYWPLTLKCADTIVTIIIPEVDTSTIRDTICSVNGSRTLVFNACADSSVTINYQIANCTAAPAAITGPADPAAFTTSVNTSGGVENISITYSGAAHTTDVSDQIQFVSPSGGTFTLTLIGHIRHDCGASSQILQCGANSQSDSLKFGTICQSQSYGPSCVPFVNTTGSTVTITLPAAPPPYSYTATNAGGQPISASPYTLANGQSITICVSINAPNIQAYDTVLNFNFQCSGGKSATFKIPLSAQVIKCNTCTCTDYHHNDITLSDNIKVGSDTMFTTEFFQNDQNCAMTIDNLKLLAQPTGWTIVQPFPTPATVPAGGNLQVTLKFKPGKAGKDNNELDFTITPAGGAAPCNGKTKLIATGCNDACADITMPAAYHLSPNGIKPDTLFLTQGGNDVFVSLANAPSVSDKEKIVIHYADTACSPKTITVTPVGNTALFQVTTDPSPLILSPNSDGYIYVQFTAPEIRKIRKDFTMPGEELKYTDIFKIIDPGCNTMDVPLKAVVDTLPGCDIFQLPDYAQIPNGSSQPFNEVYYFSNHSNPRTLPPPATGDLYFTGGTSHIINIVNANAARGFIKWIGEPAASVSCTNKQNVVADFQKFIGTAPPISVTLSSVAVGDIIIVELASGTYSILHITNITTNVTTGVEEYSVTFIYPVFF